MPHASATIRAVRLHGFGGPEQLHLDTIPFPQAHDDEVVLRVHAASVNPVDYKVRSGAFPMLKQEDLPAVLGRDLSGTVATMGPRVHTLKEGDPMIALLGRERGAYAEYVVVKATEGVVKPSSLDHVAAAAVPLAGLTAWQGLFDHGGLSRGQRVLIHGGSGGVGHLAVQFAKAKGAWVATTVSGAQVEFARSLGADQVIDYRATRFEEVVEPVDLVLDLVGGDARRRSFALVKPGGLLASALGEPSPEERGTVRAVGWRAQPNPAQLAEIGALIDAGKVRVEVTRTYPFEQAGAAQAALETEHLPGKVVLTFGAE